MEDTKLNDQLNSLLSSKKINSDTHVGWNLHTITHTLEIQIGESGSDANAQPAQDITSSNQVTEISAEADTSSIKLNNGEVWKVTAEGICKDGKVVLPQRNSANKEIVVSSLFINKAYASALYKSADSNEATFSLVNHQDHRSLINFCFDHTSDEKFVQHAAHAIPGVGDLVICSSSWTFFFWLVNGAASSEVARVNLITCNKSVDSQIVGNPKLKASQSLLTITRIEDLVNSI